MARKFWVTVKPQAKKEIVTEISPSEFKVAVREPARDGLANRRVIELLAEHFYIAKSQVSILRGQSARKKLVEID